MSNTEKKTPTRIYLVEREPLHGSEHGDDRLVRAIRRAAALAHVARRTLNARVASQDDLLRAVSRGIKVEEAGTEAEAQLGAPGDDRQLQLQLLSADDNRTDE